MRNHLLLFAVVSLLLFTGACGGSTPTATAPAVESYTLAEMLPALPSGPAEMRESSLAALTALTGDVVFESHNATLVPTTADLDAPAGVPDNLSYAIYQFPEPPQPMDIFEVEGHYFDPEPLVADPSEGYYVGIADYATGAWRIMGPFTNEHLRLPVFAELDTGSPGGFVYIAIFTHNGNHFRVDQVQTGYYTTEDYTEEWLPQPQGAFAGYGCDIQLDSAGDLQIAYLRGPLLMQESYLSLWLAQRDVGGWTTGPVNVTYGARSIRFATGDNERRALLVVTDEAPKRLMLLVDIGGGTFSTETQLSADFNSQQLGDVMWVNSLGDSLGERDAVLVVYQDVDSFPDYFLRYHYWDTVFAPTDSLIFPGSFDSPDRLTLAMQPNGRAAMCWPEENLAWSVDFIFTEYDPTAGWGACILPVLLNAEADNYGRLAGMLFAELPSGEFGHAFVAVDDRISFGRTNGPLWDAVPMDSIPIHVNEILDLAVYPTGELGYFASVGGYYPALVRKIPLTNDAPHVLALDTELRSAYFGSLEVDSAGVTHIAATDPTGSGLHYYRVETDDSITRELVDNGGGGQGMYWDKAVLVPWNDELAIFGFDAALLQVRYSINDNGVWSDEGVPIEIDTVPYVLVDAGYLEDSNLFWVATFSAMDFIIYVTTFTPGETDYVTNVLTLGLMEWEPGAGAATLADDETNLGIIYTQYSILEFTAVCAIGPPRQSPHTPEPVCTGEILQGKGFQLNYNRFADAWEAITHSDDTHHVLHYYRNAPGLWSVPHVVASQPDGSAWADAIGLDANYDTGESIITVVERPAGSPVDNLNLYVGDGATGVFGAPQLVRTIDPLVGTYMVGEGLTAPTGDGRPVISVPYRNPALDYGIWTLMPEAGGGNNYDTLYAWISPILKAGSDYDTIFRIAYMGNGRVAVSMLEEDPASPNMGQILLYYPW